MAKSCESPTIVCAQCGGTNIAVRAWVDANTNEYLSDCDGLEAYCEDCGCLVVYTTRSDFEENYPN